MSESYVPCVWRDGAFFPRTSFHAARCREEYGDGEVLMLTVDHAQSDKSRAHQFAWLRDAWANLPEQYAMEAWAQSPEHLRKYALVKSGFCDTITYPCSSSAEAQRWAANMRPMDEYSIVIARGSVVYRFVAKSQSRKAMGREEQRKSKQAILDFVAGLIGVAPEELERNGGRAA